MIIYVFQGFYNLRKYIRMMKDTLTDFSCIS